MTESLWTRPSWSSEAIRFRSPSCDSINFRENAWCSRSSVSCGLVALNRILAGDQTAKVVVLTSYDGDELRRAAHGVRTILGGHLDALLRMRFWDN
jgi:hypothetical protein